MEMYTSLYKCACVCVSWRTQFFFFSFFLRLITFHTSPTPVSPPFLSTVYLHPAANGLHSAF